MIFSTLANRTRLAIVDVLQAGSKKASEIAKTLEQEEETVSQNLKPMIAHGIVLSKGTGEERSYSLNMEIIGPLSELLSFHVDKYCPDSKQCIPPEKLREYMKAEAAKTMYLGHE